VVRSQVLSCVVVVVVVVVVVTVVVCRCVVGEVRRRGCLTGYVGGSLFGSACQAAVLEVIVAAIGSVAREPGLAGNTIVWVVCGATAAVGTL